MVRYRLNLYWSATMAGPILYSLDWLIRCALTGVRAFPVLKKLMMFSIPNFSKPMCESIEAPAV